MSAQFAELFKAEHVVLLELCWVLTLDPAASRDVAQSALAQVWRTWGSSTAPAGDPTIRLYAVAIETARDTPLRSVAPDPGGDQALVTALAEMEHAERAATGLHHLFGLAPDRCGQAMGTFPHLAAVKIQRANRLLSDRVGSGGPRPPAGIAERIRTEAQRQLEGMDLVDPSRTVGSPEGSGPSVTAWLMWPAASVVVLALIALLVTR